MPKVGLLQIIASLLLMTTPTVADVTSDDLARCQREAERSLPSLPDKGGQNWASRAASLQKRAEQVETCMRAAGYGVTIECSAPLKTFESCLKIADQITRAPGGDQYRNADWNRICLDNEWDVRTQKRLSADCYQAGSWWRRWLGQ
jgi:hypothetical protein